MSILRLRLGQSASEEEALWGALGPPHTEGLYAYIGKYTLLRGATRIFVDFVMLCSESHVLVMLLAMGEMP